MKKENYLNNLFTKVYSAIQKKAFLKKIKTIMYYIDGLISITIKKPKYINSAKKKIAIIFNLALGDGIVFNSALHNIRKVYPEKEYEITLICQKGLEKIFSNIKFDEIIGINFTKATINLKERYKNIKKLQEKYYDILLDPVGANECFTNVLTSKTIYAKYKIGCIIDNMSKKCPKKILKKTYNEITILKEKTLIGQYYEFFYKKYEIIYHKSNYNVKKIKLPPEYYIIFPSASTELKKWPIEKYAEIVKKIYKKTKLPIMFCGTNSDIESVDKLKKLIKDIPQYDYVNKTSILEFFDVIKNAKFVITNDTSTYHIAVINEVPVAIVTGGYTFDRYVEYDFKGNNKYRKPYIIVHKMECFNCYNCCCKIEKEDKVWPCLEKISVSDAWKVIEEMIDKEL